MEEEQGEREGPVGSLTGKQSSSLGSLGWFTLEVTIEGTFLLKASISVLMSAPFSADLQGL